MTHRKKRELRWQKLDELYAQLPRLECRGICGHACCGAIAITVDE